MPKAYVFTRYGGPETEALVVVDRPRPGPGEVLAEAATLLDDRTKLITARAPAEVVERLGCARVTRSRTSGGLAAVAQPIVGGARDPLVTRTFPLKRAGEALRTVEAGQARGKVAIEVAG